MNDLDLTHDDLNRIERALALYEQNLGFIAMHHKIQMNEEVDALARTRSRISAARAKVQS